MIVAPGQSVG